MAYAGLCRAPSCCSMTASPMCCSWTSLRACQTTSRHTKWALTLPRRSLIGLWPSTTPLATSSASRMRMTREHAPLLHSSHPARKRQRCTGHINLWT